MCPCSEPSAFSAAQPRPLAGSQSSLPSHENSTPGRSSRVASRQSIHPQKLPDYAVRYYIDTLASNPDAVRGSFAQYRDFDTTIAQNEQRKTWRLTLPVLAIGGANGIGEAVVNTMKLVADDVRGLLIPGWATARRGGSRGVAGGADHVPGPIPERNIGTAPGRPRACNRGR